MSIPVYTPVTELQAKYKETILKTKDGPVILSQYSKPIAVLLSTDAYEKLVADAQEAKRLRRWQKAEEAAARMAAGDYIEMKPNEILALG